jgi:alpha-tubulin suppressor-like RCC1 family protein
VTVSACSACGGAGSCTPSTLGGSVLAYTVSHGQGFGCALRGDGRAFCWGRQTTDDRTLGNGSNTNHTTPVAVLNGAGPGVYTQLESGDLSTCALGVDSNAYCWGNSPVLQSGGPYIQVTVGRDHRCFLANDGKAYCAGSNTLGQRGNGTTTGGAGVNLVVNGAGPGVYKQIAAGRFHTCGLAHDGRAYCWGQNLDGALGDGTTTTPRLTPVLVQDGAGPGTYTQLRGGSFYTCGLATNQRVYCWGRNTSGNLGDGTTTARLTPVLVQNGQSPGTFKTIGPIAKTNNDTTCGIGTDDKGYCWGDCDYGQCGDGSTTSPRTTPRLVLNGASPGTFKQIATGYDVTASGSNNMPYGWGWNNSGSVGDGTSSQRTSPVAILSGAGLTSVLEPNICVD